MQINFCKMQGLGNDFILVNYQDEIDYSTLAKKLCDRHFGIGADGLIVINPRKVPKCNASWEIYNSDGSIAQMCGNGIRCFAKYLSEKSKKREFKIATRKGLIIPKILENGEIKVDMGTPILDKKLIPFKGREILNFSIVADNAYFTANAISMGNPHCVIFNDGNTRMLAEIYGGEIESNSLFPHKTNVEFVKIISRKEIDLNVFERGCGVTMACGTGSCAAVAVGILNNLLDKKVKVNLAGGSLTIEWDGNVKHSIFMTGPAEFVFKGKFEL